LENYALPQPNNNNNHILHLDGAWIGRGEPTAWPPCSPNLRHMDFFLWDYVKDQVYSKGVNTLEELKARITAATATDGAHNFSTCV
jgi:hypothetical protein